MSITDKMNEKLEPTNQSQNESETNNQQNTNPVDNGKYKIKLVINGKEEVREYTQEELAAKLQLSEVSTQRFQESSELKKSAEKELLKALELYEKMSANYKNIQNKEQTTEKKIVKDDYPDDLLIEFKKLKEEVSSLKNEQSSVLKTVKEREHNEQLNNIINRYGVTREFIDKEVLPFMSTRAIDDVETAIQAVLFQKGKTKASTITSDGNGVTIEGQKSEQDMVLDSIFSQSRLGITARLNKK